MAKKTKRQKAIKRLNLSDYTLDINIRRCNYSKFSFSEIEEYVRELVGSRDYQYAAIKQIIDLSLMWRLRKYCRSCKEALSKEAINLPQKNLSFINGD